MRVILNDWPRSRVETLMQWLGAAAAFEDAVRAEIARLEIEAMNEQVQAGVDSLCPRAKLALTRSRELRATLSVISDFRAGRIQPVSVTIIPSEP